MAISSTDKPTVSIRFEPASPVIEDERVNVTLHCDVTEGNPRKLLKVQWMIDGMILTELPECNGTKITLSLGSWRSGGRRDAGKHKQFLSLTNVIPHNYPFSSPQHLQHNWYFRRNNSVNLPFLKPDSTFKQFISLFPSYLFPFSPTSSL